MKDFDFDKYHADSLKTISRVQKFAVYIIIGNCILGLSVLGFVGWVILKVMAHYGIL